MKLKILGIEPAISKAKKVYYKVQTNQGDMTAFDEKIVEAITDTCRTGREINLEVVPSADGKYQNIRGFAMDDEEEQFDKMLDTAVVKPQEFGIKKKEVRQSVKGSAYEKDPVGLAVEVFNALWDKILIPESKDMAKGVMEASIDLVKQAQKAFS